MDEVCEFVSRLFEVFYLHIYLFIYCHGHTEMLELHVRCTA